MAPETPTLAPRVEREEGVEEEEVGRWRWGRRRRRKEFWKCRHLLPIIEESDDSEDFTLQ